MPRRLSLLTSVMVFACAICAPAKAAPSADAVYSNLETFQNDSFAAGGATQQVLNTITRMAADDLNLVGTPPYSINGFRFTVTNRNAVDVTARPLVRFYLPDGPGGGPGTLIEARTYNPIVFAALSVGKVIKTSSTFVLNSSSIWAGIAFDDNGGTTAQRQRSSTTWPRASSRPRKSAPAPISTSSRRMLVHSPRTTRSARFRISAGHRRRISVGRS